MNLFYINSVFLSVIILCYGCGNKAQQGTSNTENTSTATNSLNTNNNLQPPKLTLEENPIQTRLQQRLESNNLQLPELPLEENPIQTRLQQKLESKALEHPAMVSLITFVLINNIEKKTNNQELSQFKNIEQWLCLNRMHVTSKNLDVINDLRNKIIDFLNKEPSTNKWEYSKCADIRREVATKSDKSFLSHTQEALYNELDNDTKEPWLAKYKTNPLICTHYSQPKDQKIHTITSMLPGFSDISSISIQLDGQEQDFEHTNLESGKTLFNSHPYNDKIWRAKVVMDDHNSVSCDINFKPVKCNDMIRKALNDQDVTYGEYWVLIENDYESLKKSDKNYFKEKRNNICPNDDFNNQSQESEISISEKPSNNHLERRNDFEDLYDPSPLVCRLTKVNYEDKTAEIEIIYRGDYGSAKQVQYFIENGNLRGSILSTFKQNSKYSKAFEITDTNNQFTFSISAKAAHVYLDCSITIPSIQTTKEQEIAQNPKPQAQEINSVNICELRRKQALKNKEIDYSQYVVLKKLDHVPLTLNKGKIFAPRIECQEYKSWF